MKRTRLILTIDIVLFSASLALGTVQASAQEQSAVSAQVYRVQWGDTLFRIALRYGTTVASLKEWNGIQNANLIYAGQVLRVSGGVSNPPPVGKTYTVQWGDTLNRIARWYGINLTVLARVNNIANPNLIYAGQRLTIPDVTIQ
jgi:LysM repeat protein